jgi:hypothetical protein
MEDHPVSLTPLAEGGSDGGLIGLGDQFAADYRPDDATRDARWAATLNRPPNRLLAAFLSN